MHDFLYSAYLGLNMFGVDDVLFYSFGTALAGSFGLLLFLHHQSQEAHRRLAHAEGRISQVREHLEHASLMVSRARRMSRGKASLRYAEEKISRAITELLTANEELQKIQPVPSKGRSR
jgi:hypothetical protein